MNDTRWFTELTDDIPRRTWLGIVARPPRIAAHAPAQRPIPRPDLPPANTFNPRLRAADQPTTYSSPVPRPSSPRSFIDHGLAEETDLRGTVNLAGLGLLPGSPFLPPWQRDAEAGDGDSSSSAPLDVPDDISLAKRLAFMLQPSTAVLLAPEGPLDWTKPLLPYQLTGVQQLLARNALLLADDMGLGKTIQALAALRILVVQRRVESALVIVPAGLVAQWRGELRGWAPELRVSVVHGSPRERAWRWRSPAHVYLTSYETLRSDYSEHPAHRVARLWDLLVLDEAQKIKNAETELSRLCKRLKRRRQWALTGTPLENNPDDLASLLDFVDPGGARERRGFVMPSELRGHLARLQLRRRKADVLRDLPPKLVSQIVLPLAPRQRQTYERAEREGVYELRRLGDAARVEAVLDLIARLKAICNVCPVSGESSKLADLQERVEVLAAEGHKALIFSQYANERYGARAIAARLPVPTLIYTGDLPTSQRERILERFRADPEQVALVLSLLAGGQGLNLQAASYVFHFDRWWNPAVEQQAEARSHRLGQQQPVHVYAYICQDTIEERIERILKAKRRLFDELVDDVSIDVTATMNAEDLFGLFGLPTPQEDRTAPP